jgi:TolB-like protein
VARADRVLQVIAVAAALGRGVALSAQCPDGSAPPCTRAAIHAPAPNSVAVLYFDNLSRDTSDAYVADGLTEELITRLGQIERLQVKSRTAVQRYRGRSINDPAVLGRQLGVAHLVSGSVQQGGGRLRVTVELTRAASGLRVWGERYERSSDDLMAVEADIAQAIAERVGGQLAPAERRSLSARPTRNVEAYDHFLRGNHFLALRTPSDVRLGIEQYERAVGLDPSFTGALARIGYGYALFLDWGWVFPGLPRDSVLARGFAVADRALALDSNAADAWMTRGYLLSFRNPRTFEGVNASFQRAIALNPRNAEAHHQYGFLLVMAGANEAGHDELKRALELEPERAISLVTSAFERRLARRDDEALTLLDSALVLEPGAAWAYARRSLWRPPADIAGARADAEAAVRLRPADYPIEAEAALAAAEFRGGDAASARARLARLSQSLVTPGTQEGFLAAVAFAAGGDADGAIMMLGRVMPRGAVLWSLMRDPWFDSLRTDPRFQHLVEASRPPGR